ncbi:hypothetical protein EQ875_01634 [Photobacterium damselae subsp. damselae]|uniref:conserved phage C-terminal domain-containing protein n=1 Tax=Photobacterium damselae TaxID=38293 RepID=UPI00109B7A8F|nr:conserved phage C-terminal domain-containing protein [Photobacterium damselae]TGZ35353.1 hypothetical protein EQ875_01634 [Photobacterium damselae subsp. damselae]
MYRLLSELVGQEANLSVPRIFIRMCDGNYNHAAVLAQLVFWSNKSARKDGWFYKSQQELADELELSRDQVKRSVKKLATSFSNAIFTELKKANGAPTTHYRVDIKALLEIAANHSAQAPNPLGESAQSIVPIRPTQGMGESAQSITDPNHIRSTDPKSIMSSKHDDTSKPESNNSDAKQVIQYLNTVTNSKYQACKSSIGPINARLSEGFTLQELFLVIEHKQREWGQDSKMAQYLRPSTLFSPSKFAGYLRAARVAEERPNSRPITAADLDDTTWAQNLDVNDF